MNDLKRFDMNGTPHVSGQYCNAQEAADLIKQLQQRNVELLRGNDQLGSKVEELEQREADLESKAERLECELQDQLPDNSGAASDAYFHCQDMITPYLGHELSDTTLINSVCGSLEFLIEQWQLNKGIKQERDELAAHVERLREACTKAVEQVPEIACILGFAEATQMKSSASLNAVRLNALMDFRHDCGSMNGYHAVDVWDKMDEYIKGEFS